MLESREYKVTTARGGQTLYEAYFRRGMPLRIPDMCPIAGIPVSGVDPPAPPSLYLHLGQTLRLSPAGMERYRQSRSLVRRARDFVHFLAQALRLPIIYHLCLIVLIMLYYFMPLWFTIDLMLRRPQLIVSRRNRGFVTFRCPSLEFLSELRKSNAAAFVGYDSEEATKQMFRPNVWVIGYGVVVSAYAALILLFLAQWAWNKAFDSRGIVLEMAGCVRVADTECLKSLNGATLQLVQYDVPSSEQAWTVQELSSAIHVASALVASKRSDARAKLSLTLRRTGFADWQIVRVHVAPVAH